MSASLWKIQMDYFLPLLSLTHCLTVSLSHCLTVRVGDTDSSSGDEFFWVGGAEGHNMRKEQRKILREDFNVLHEIFDSLDEQKFKREVRERKEREAKEEAERCPTDIAGKPYDLLCYTVVL